MKAGLVQLSSGDDPKTNLSATQDLIAQAAEAGAQFVLTPEVTNCVSLSRQRQDEVLRNEIDDETLASLSALAHKFGIHLLIGSLALKTDDPNGRFANRSFLIAPDGSIAARYDKIHMFDVEVSASETYEESAGYRPGEQATIADVGDVKLGMTICYDLRFPQLYRKLAQAGAEVISVPSAFSPVTGAAHWHVLLRARAIETGSYILAPAQTGEHAARDGRPRKTYGHSLVVNPWGEIMIDAATDPGVSIVEIDVAAVQDARRRIPSLFHDREFSGP